MLHTSTIDQIPVDTPTVYAFRVRGELTAKDLKAMGATMNDAFDLHPSLSMLLVFEQFEGVEAGAGFDMETVRSQFRSLAKVDKYAVVNAPSVASALITVMDKLIPTEARTFDASEEGAAWAFVGASPVPLHKRPKV